MKSKQDTIRDWCGQHVGCPYVYGGTGKQCTPEYRQARATQYPTYAAKIKRNCSRMNGTASACKGCIWADPETGQGRDAFDCAQLHKYAMEAIGIPMVSGANSQWERTDWAFRGKIADGYPEDEVCSVFRWDKDHMGHVGVYQGDGTVIHAKGHDWGVVRERLADTDFTHWGQAEGLLDESPWLPVLRQGAVGAEVMMLQTILCEVVGEIDADGVFGSKTAAAVKAFQKEAGLTVDGVVGPKTWQALKEKANMQDDVGEDGAPEEPDSAEAPDADALTPSELSDLRACLEKALNILGRIDQGQKGGNVG